MLKNILTTRFLSTACALLLLSGCAVKQAPPPEEVLESTLPETTQVIEEWVAPVDSGKVDDGWLNSFNDQRLEALVAEVLENNQDLQAAAAQVDAAAALAVQASAALKPTIGLGAAASTVDASGLPTSLESSNVFLNASWEIDIWGRVRAGAAAGEAIFQATESDYEFARQSLVAQTTKAWFLATQIKGQMELAQEAVDIYARLVELTEVRTQHGLAQPQDLPLAKSNLAGAQSNLRQIESSYQEILRSLEVLLGRYPSADLEAVSQFVAVPPSIPAGLPSEILERRPDLVAAERRVAAAFFGSQEARAARLPRISLTAGAGAIDNGLADILNVGNPVVGLGGDLFAPLYAGGALQAGVEIADAQKRAVMAVYAQTALQAFQEVEVALTNEQLLKEREAFLQTAVAKGDEAYRITQAQYEIGRVELLALLQTQAALLSTRSSLIAVTNERLAERVNLHLALGGSFAPIETQEAK